MGSAYSKKLVSESQLVLSTISQLAKNHKLVVALMVVSPLYRKVVAVLWLVAIRFCFGAPWRLFGPISLRQYLGTILLRTFFNIMNFSEASRVIRLLSRASQLILPMHYTKVQQPDFSAVIMSKAATLQIEKAPCVLLYVHGGAFIFGNATQYGMAFEYLLRHLPAGSCIVSVEYSLAPESVFPAARDEIFAAYRWLGSAGVPRSRVIIAGDSAGGNLALGAALQLKEHEQPQPAGIVLVSPWVDISSFPLSFVRNGKTDYVTPQFMLAPSLYLGSTGLDTRDPRISPAFADLDDLAPILVVGGGAEMMVDDIDRFVAVQSKNARVNMTYHRWDGMPHIWPLLPELFGQPAYSMLELLAQNITQMVAVSL